MTDKQQQTFEHLQANAVGVLDTRFDEDQPLAHFRGIKYASIPERFAAPILESRQKSTRLQATEFGPRCPQVPVDVRDLMQIPKHLDSFPADAEDEFECLNLNITLPAKNTGKLPVLVWIYGGAQIVSFSTSSQRLCETGPLIAQSIASQQPIIIVNPNHRLNILAYGDGTPSGERNLHIQDLQAAVQWVFNNISDFGGDVSRITIAGESAGSILTHALCLTLPQSLPISRAILCSGSLGTSRFQPPSFFAPTLDRILTTARGLAVQQSHPNAETLTLRTIPTSLLIASMAANALNSIPLQTTRETATLPSPSEALTRLSALMIGDCEFEGVLWLAGIRLIASTAIRSLFLGPTSSPALQRLAATYLDDPSTATGHDGLGLTTYQAAALSFMGDYLFHHPNQDIIRDLTTSTPPTAINPNPQTKTKVYTYLFDQPNPFSTSALHATPGAGVPRAHHGVDLLALWDGFAADYPANSPFIPVAHTFRAKVLEFVNGREVWVATPAFPPSSSGSSGSTTSSSTNKASAYAYLFGPTGQHGPITANEYSQRRRTNAIQVMREVGQEVVDGVFGRLMREIEVEMGRVLAQMGGKQGAEREGDEEQEQEQEQGQEQKVEKGKDGEGAKL